MMVDILLLFIYCYFVIASSQDDAKKRSANKFHQSGRRHKMMMASFSFPELYGCIDDKEKIVPKEDERRSQAREDEWLWDKIFSKLPRSEVYGGTFIEIGALDGEQYSNTWYFEKKWDWRGLLIEGHPLNTPHLRKKKVTRKNSVIYAAAVCRLDSFGNPGSVEFSRRANALGTTKETSKSYTNHWHEGTPDFQYTMPCIPLQEMLDATGVLDVDLFSLDVEGAELLVLQTIDWQVTNIRVLVVEADGFDAEKDAQVREHMKSLGYVNSKDMNLGSMTEYCNATTNCGIHNDVYVNPRFQERKLSRAKAYNGLNRYYNRNTGERCNTTVSIKK